MPKVKEVMRRYVVSVTPNITVSRAAQIMTNNRIGSVIVLENNNPTGILTVEDIVALISRGQNPGVIKVGEIPKREFVTVSPEDDIVKVARKMIKSGVKRMPVIRNGNLEGIITDKELLVVSPQLIEILSEKLKMRIERVAQPDQLISGICEKCESYSDELKNLGGRWLCEDCRN